MNILISAVGRRVSLVNAFKKTIIDNKLDSKVFVTDLEPETRAAASHFSDGAFKVGKFSDRDYLEKLRDICIRNDVSLIIPTNDNELRILSSGFDYFMESGIRPIISRLPLVDSCQDKRETKLLFDGLNVSSPRIFNTPEEFVFPLFIKPTFGSNSSGIYKAEGLGDIKTDHINSEDFILMEYISQGDYQEYTVDLYYNRESYLVCAVPRIRIKTVGGESNQGITKKNHVLDFVKYKFKCLDGAIGCITLQVFANLRDKDDIIGIEINPRFGGGYPFSLNAGANFPEFIIEEYLLGREINYQENWKSNILKLRYEKEVFFYHDF